jgi:hypothetical protein
MGAKVAKSFIFSAGVLLLFTAVAEQITALIANAGRQRDRCSRIYRLYGIIICLLAGPDARLALCASQAAWERWPF